MSKSRRRPTARAMTLAVAATALSVAGALSMSNAFATTSPAAAPTKPATVKPTPVKPTPVKPTPVKPTPVKPTPVKPTPVKPAPAQGGPNYFTATLSSLDMSARTVVAQSATLKTGERYCADHGLPSTDATCRRAWVVDASAEKITIPLSPKLTLTSADGNPDCIGADGFGICPVDVSKISALIQRTPLFRVDMKSGQAINLAAVYTP